MRAVAHGAVDAASAISLAAMMSGGRRGCRISREAVTHTRGDRERALLPLARQNADDVAGWDVHAAGKFDYPSLSRCARANFNKRAPSNLLPPQRIYCLLYACDRLDRRHIKPRANKAQVIRTEAAGPRQPCNAVGLQGLSQPPKKASKPVGADPHAIWALLLGSTMRRRSG
jgi:hypothetical protein